MDSQGEGKMTKTMFLTKRHWGPMLTSKYTLLQNVDTLFLPKSANVIARLSEKAAWTKYIFYYVHSALCGFILLTIAAVDVMAIINKYRVAFCPSPSGRGGAVISLLAVCTGAYVAWHPKDSHYVLKLTNSATCIASFVLSCVDISHQLRPYDGMFYPGRCELWFDWLHAGFFSWVLGFGALKCLSSFNCGS